MSTLRATTCAVSPDEAVLRLLPRAPARRIPHGVKKHDVRSRVASHLHQLVTLAATTTLTTTACACDMLPPPARVPLDPQSFSASAMLVEEASTIYLDITLTNSGLCTYDSTFSDVEGSLVVKVTGGPGMTIRVRPTSSSTHVAGVVVCERTDGTKGRAKVRLDVDLPTAQTLPVNVTVQAKAVSDEPGR